MEADKITILNNVERKRLIRHENAFGKGNHDEMNPPCSIIKQLK